MFNLNLCQVVVVVVAWGLTLPLPLSSFANATQPWLLES